MTTARTTRTTRPARVALVGDRSPHVKSHTRVPGLLDALASRDGLVLDAYWIPTGDAAAEAASGALARFDAVWLLPGSPYASEAGRSPRSGSRGRRASRSSGPAADSSTHCWSTPARSAGWPASRTPRTTPGPRSC